MGISSFYAFHIDRYLYWFPEWFVMGVEKGISYDIPRYSFSIFQLPSWLLNILGADNYVQTKLTGLLLGIYPFFSFYLIWKFIRETEHRFFIYPLLISFLTFFYLVSAPSFNGALHSYVSYWLLVAFALGIYSDKNKYYFSALYLLFYFFYPPASFTGSALLSWKFRERKDHNFYLMVVGAVLSLCYLLFFKFFSDYPIYTETLIGIRGTIFSPLGLLYILLIYFFFRFKYATEKRVYFHLLIIIFLGFHIYEGWNIFLLGHQYHYRVFSYTLGFVPLLFIDNFKDLKDIEQKLVNSYSVFLVLIFLADIRSSYLFQKDIDLLQEVVRNEKSKQTCITQPRLNSLVSHQDDINSLTFLIPRLNAFEKILLPEKSYTNKLFRKYCN